MRLEARMRDGVMWLLVLSVFVSSLFVVNVRHQHRLAYLAFQSEQTRQDALGDEWGQLLVEAHTYASANSIEKAARENLAMRAPKKQEIEYIGGLYTQKSVGHSNGSD